MKRSGYRAKRSRHSRRSAPQSSTTASPSISLFSSLESEPARSSFFDSVTITFSCDDRTIATCSCDARPACGQMKVTPGKRAYKVWKAGQSRFQSYTSQCSITGTLRRSTSASSLPTFSPSGGTQRPPPTRLPPPDDPPAAVAPAAPPPPPPRGPPPAGALARGANRRAGGGVGGPPDGENV